MRTPSGCVSRISKKPGMLNSTDVERNSDKAFLSTAVIAPTCALSPSLRSTREGTSPGPSQWGATPPVERRNATECPAETRDSKRPDPENYTCPRVGARLHVIGTFFLSAAIHTDCVGKKRAAPPICHARQPAMWGNTCKFASCHLKVCFFIEAIVDIL
jgi:hypothetical protein